MLIRVKVQRNQIHHWLDVPAEGGGTREVLEFGINYPDYPDLPTYGFRLDFPITKAKVLAAITEKTLWVKDQMQRDENVRQQVEDMGYLEFTIDV